MNFINAWLASVETKWVEPARPTDWVVFPQKRKPIERWLAVVDGISCMCFTRPEYIKPHYENCDVKTVHLIEATEAKEVWRLLEVGEITRDGDEVHSVRKWRPEYHGMTVTDMDIVRRRVRVVEVVQ